MHSCSNLFLVALFTLAPLFLLFGKPAEILGADLNPVTVDKASELVLPVSAPRARSQTTIWTPNGLLGDNYFIRKPATGMAFTYEFKDESRTNSGTTSTDSYHRFKERVAFKTNGWVYHPALMQYSLMIEPEWIQSLEERDPDETARINSFSPDYALTTTFLQDKPYTFNIFASRREYPVWAAFAGSTETISDTYGTNIRLKYKALPTTLGYAHIETDQTGFYTSQNIRDNFHLTSRHQSAKSNTSLSSTYSDDKRSTEGIDTQINTFNNNLTNNFRITGDNRINLNSFLTYRTQTSDTFDTENIRLREQLNWRHQYNLQSNYSFTHDRQQSGESETDRTSLDARLTHLLYENLSTNVGARTDLYNYSNGEENAYNTFLDFAYSRPISWGTLNLNTGWNYIYTDRSGPANSITQVINEAHTLGPTQETFLDNYNVDPDSIIVTNTPGTIVYIENIDYTVDIVNDFARINYLPFGSITAGQLIMVSYRYLRESAYDDAVFTENYGINTILFHDLYLSYNYMRANQNILSGQAPNKLIDDTIQRSRIRYSTGWSDTTLDYEDNNRQSSRPYTRWKIQETLRYSPLWQMYFSLKGYVGQTSYSDNDEIRDFYGAVTTFDWLLARWCKFRLEGYYDQINSDVEETINSSVKAGFEFRYRIWTARLSYEFTDQNNVTTEYQLRKQLFRFEIIRLMW